jgi:hypothetical protein
MNSSNVCRNQLPAAACYDACTCLAASQASLGRSKSARASNHTAVEYLIYCHHHKMKSYQAVTATVAAAMYQCNVLMSSRHERGNMFSNKANLLVTTSSKFVLPAGCCC